MKLTGEQRKQMVKDVLDEASDYEYEKNNHSDEFEHLSRAFFILNNYDLKDIGIKEKA
jgi:hypothetical protein